jgi:hypothetical protein
LDSWGKSQTSPSVSWSRCAKARVFCDLQPDSGELGTDPMTAWDDRWILSKPNIYIYTHTYMVINGGLMVINGDLMGFHGG